MTENPTQVAQHISSNASAASALIGDPAKFGRVGDDGTVYVQTPAGERAVGSYPGKSADEALAYFVRKFESVASEVALLGNRIRSGAMVPSDAHEAVKKSVKRIFYSSSACMYPEHNQLDPNNPNCEESSAYPANPDSEYGWEKLFSERLYLAFNRNYGLNVRIARFHNKKSELHLKFESLPSPNLLLLLWAAKLRRVGRRACQFLYFALCAESGLSESKVFLAFSSCNKGMSKVRIY